VENVTTRIDVYRTFQNYITFVFILHFWASPTADCCEAEPTLYDEKNVGVNKKDVYADRAALTVLSESYDKANNHFKQ